MQVMLETSNQVVKHYEQKILNNVRMNLQDRIQELLDEFPDKKKSHLAKFVGVSRTTPTDWTTGKTKNINGEHAYKVAEFFGEIEPYWVQTGKGPKYRNSEIHRPAIENGGLLQAIEPRSPVINEDEWKALPPKARALIEDFLTQTSSGKLSDSKIKLLQNMIDEFSQD